MSELTGKVVVVTGAGSGIGRATARLLARRGATVHAADVDADGVNATVEVIAASGGRATAHVVDVTDADAVAALADEVYTADGRVDVLFNNAGIGQAGPTQDVPLEIWRRVIEVNLMGVVHGIHAFGPRMLAQAGGGHIINTASMAGLTAAPQLVPYATTKHAVVGLTESLDAEWAPLGVRITALCPGVINTPITHSSTLHGRARDSRERVVRFYERFGATADDVAEAVLDAIHKRPVIRTVPRSHVIPAWLLRRISPRLAQRPARLSQRLLR